VLETIKVFNLFLIQLTFAKRKGAEAAVSLTSDAAEPKATGTSNTNPTALVRLYTTKALNGSQGLVYP
jgi:hypothetical protein